MKRSQKLFGVAALFNTPDEIIKAAQGVSDGGYTKYDVHSPYPVHGMDNAMKLKPSKLGYITLVFGLMGAAVALISMYLTMAKDYPMIIGGKPFFALPAFIPVTFELTVLFATLSTVIGMIAFFFKFPSNAHPLHDTAYMKAVSHDKFGLCIESDDALFEEAKCQSLLQGLGAFNIEPIYYPEAVSFNTFSAKFLGFLLLVAVLVSGGTYFTLNKVLYMVPFTWMSQQEKLTTQSKSDFFKDGFGMRMPVKGTVARGYIPYPYKGIAQQPAMPLSNPLMPTKAVLELGKKKFLTFCSPCHGNYADGESRLRGQFPKPPSLHSTKVREWADGNIFHVIMVGQNVMPSYANQVTADEAWSIIYYVRSLQKAKNASEEDIQTYKKEVGDNVTK
jgi:mono/diheme cytochrome c family protein